MRKSTVPLTPVETVRAQLAKATTFGEIFGKVDSLDKLKKQFHQLARIVHPDHNLNEKKEAHDTWTMLQAFHRAAEESLKNKTYERKFQPGDCTKAPVSYPETVLQSKIATYRLEPNIFRDGDFSALYKAKVVKAKPTDKDVVLVKISALPEHNALLEHEAKIINKFTTDNKLRNITQFVPKLLDSFVVPDTTGKRFRANVYSYSDGYYTVTDIVKAFKTPLDPRDAAWICRRVISQVIAAKLAGVVHGAIVPDHILVHPISHDPIHIGWAHAVDHVGGRNRISLLIERWRDWFPPEVFDKKTPDQRTDIFMVGKTMIYLLGGNTKTNAFPSGVPVEMQRLILRCVDPNRDRRPESGEILMTSFTDMLLKLWGRKYRKLEMPGR